MKIAIVGATGRVGRRILDEALRRDHRVTGIARDASKLLQTEGFTLVAGDAGEPAVLAATLADHDAVVSAVPFRTSDPAKVIDAVRRSRLNRCVVVGGAGSLEVEPGKLLVDTPNFPDFAREEARAGKRFLDALRDTTDVNWTMLSPSALLVAGQRTSLFRLGKDTLLTAHDGKSWISYEDYAVALLDELERPKHLYERFTVGY
jgi:putative NADH-flavin reductase